jgi:hypothetical protein
MIKLYLFHCLDGAHSEYEFVRRLGVINFVLAIIEKVLLAPLHNIWGQNQNRWKKRQKVGSITEIRYTEVRWKKSICFSHLSSLLVRLIYNFLLQPVKFAPGSKSSV